MSSISSGMTGTVWVWDTTGDVREDRYLTRTNRRTGRYRPCTVVHTYRPAYGPQTAVVELTGTYTSIPVLAAHIALD